MRAGAVILDSVVGVGATVGQRTIVDGCVIGGGARVGADNELARGSRVWTNVTIPDRSIRLSSDQS